MKYFEILPSDGIFVASPQETHVIGVLQFLNSRGKATELFEIEPDGARVFDAAMNHLLFLVTTNFESDPRYDGSRSNRDERDKQHQHKQNVPVLGVMLAS